MQTFVDGTAWLLVRVRSPRNGGQMPSLESPRCCVVCVCVLLVHTMYSITAFTLYVLYWLAGETELL